MSDLQSILPQIRAWFFLSIVCGLIGGGLYGLLKINHRTLLPPQRYRAVPWGSIEIAIVLFMIRFGVPAILAGILARSGFFSWLYGTDFPVPFAARELVNLPDSVMARWEIWISLFSFPFSVAIIPVLLYLGSGTRPYQLGLTLYRWVENIAAGCLGWLLLTPLVFGVDILAICLFKSWLNVQPTEHPLMKLAFSQPKEFELYAIILVAVVAAPIIEELLFRGLIQNWLASFRWGGGLALAASLGIAFYYGREKADFWPMAFVMLMAPGYYFLGKVAWRWLPRPQASRAIYSTSLLFAVFHSPVWPSPIPLFVLSLGLGYLAYRSQSLVGPMLLHGLFNCVAAVSLFYLPPSPNPPNGKETTSALPRLPSISISSIVPGS